MAVKRVVYDKLDSKTKENATYTECATVARALKPGTSDFIIKEMVRNIVKPDGKHKRLIFTYLKYLRATANNISNSGALASSDDKSLEECLFYADIITHSILSYNSNLEPIDHGIIARKNFGSLSANRALGRINIMGVYEDPDFKNQITIKQKEQEIIDHMRDTGTYLSPTQIGITVGKQKKNAASSWALRSLTKLIDLRLVIKNSKGHYRVVSDV